jgi:hypothetical protein
MERQAGVLQARLGVSSLLQPLRRHSPYLAASSSVSHDRAPCSRMASVMCRQLHRRSIAGSRSALCVSR